MAESDNRYSTGVDNDRFGNCGNDAALNREVSCGIEKSKTRIYRSVFVIFDLLCSARTFISRLKS